MQSFLLLVDPDAAAPASWNFPVGWKEAIPITPVTSFAPNYIVRIDFSVALAETEQSLKVSLATGAAD